MTPRRSTTPTCIAQSLGLRPLDSALSLARRALDRSSPSATVFRFARSLGAGGPTVLSDELGPQDR